MAGLLPILSIMRLCRFAEQIALLRSACCHTRPLKEFFNTLLWTGLGFHAATNHGSVRALGPSFTAWLDSAEKDQGTRRAAVRSPLVSRRWICLTAAPEDLFWIIEPLMLYVTARLPGEGNMLRSRQESGIIKYSGDKQRPNNERGVDLRAACGRRPHVPPPILPWIGLRYFPR
jgi:hypothetical protein